MMLKKNSTVVEASTITVPETQHEISLEKDDSFCLIKNMSSNTSLKIGTLLGENQKTETKCVEVKHTVEEHGIENILKSSDDFLNFSMPSAETSIPTIKSDIQLG